MSHRTFADITADDTIDCGTNTATREEMIEFAREFDPLDMHVDPDAAAGSPFGGLIASGIHTFALTQPPVVEHFYADSDLIAARDMDQVRLPAPVRPDDVVHVSLDILDTDVTANGRGLVTTRRTARVDDEIVFELRNRTVWER